MANEFEHPLEKQNALEREIQLEGSKDPDNYIMPDGRTLSQVREALEVKHREEFKEETRMIGRTTREISSPEFHKGEKLVMTSAGSIVDVTEPPEPESNVTLHTSRTAAEDREFNPPGNFEAPRSMEPMPSASPSSETETSVTPPPSTEQP